MNKYTDLGSRVTRSMTPDITNRMSKPQTYASFNTGLMNYEFRKQMTWRYVHSSPVKRKSIPQSSSPSNSVYKINSNIPENLSYPNISALTLRENTKNENSHQDLHSLTQRLPRKLSNSESLFRLVNKDYVRIINRLDKVATNQGLMTRRIDITDGRPMELILDQGEVQYFYITVKNKKCPLRIQLVKKGKLVTYMSKSTPEPSEELCEEEFNNDDFQISDPGIRFSCEHVFLAVKALEDAKYQIKAAFGRKKESPKKRSMSSTMVKSRTVKTLEQVRNDNELRHDLYYRVSLLIEKRRKNMYELSNHKDFVKLNLKIKDDREDLRSMTERRDRKHKEAGLRKQDIEESKKKIKMNLLNRHAIRQANLSSQRKLLEKRFQNIKTHKFWLSLLYLGKSIKKCIKIVKRNKNIKLKQNQVVWAVRRIQRSYRSYLIHKCHNMPTEKVRARDLLLLFAQVSKIFIRPKYKLQILNCIKQSKTNHIVKYNFEHYIKSILLTQFYWRKYQEIKKTRLAELFKSWNLVLGKLIKEDLKNTKRKKKSNIDSGKYFYINKGAQTFVLNEYMNEKTKQVYSIMRLKCGRIFVGFKPSSKEMRWLIERAANIGISIEKT